MAEWYDNLSGAVEVQPATSEQQKVSAFDDITGYLAETAESAIDSIDAGFALGVANAIGQGVTFGFADEAIAGIASLGGYDYEEVRDAIRENLDQFRDENTAIAYGAEIASSLLAPLGLFGLLGLWVLKVLRRPQPKRPLTSLSPLPLLVGQLTVLVQQRNLKMCLCRQRLVVL